ncbi:MAG: hypothetical protein ILO43_07170 [Clostridia bacterium]|nr:hypothetical protein [Clostridia bacterium]
MKQKRPGLETLVLNALRNDYPIMPGNAGEESVLRKNGFRFQTRVYEAEGLGHLCFLTMTAMAGLMQMETAIVAVYEKDIPLLNLDWVKAMGKETQMVEFYDDQLAPYPAEKLAAFEAIKAKDADLTDRETDPHWYDDILYPCSYDKTGKGCSERFTAAVEAYLKEYTAQLKTAADCDREEKRARVRNFAETLFSQGGPAVDQVTKLFGPEVAKRLILGHMYGVLN